MNKIIKLIYNKIHHRILIFIGLFFISTLFMGGWIIIEKIYAKVIPSELLWHYNELKPTKSEYKIGEPIIIYSDRWLLTESEILWRDYLYCNSDEKIVNGETIKMKRYLYQSSGRPNSGRSIGDWVYGQDSIKDFYKTKKEGTDCYIVSKQTLIYHGVKKHQTFDSQLGPFNIIK